MTTDQRTGGEAQWLIPDDRPIDWRSKCFGPGQRGCTVAALVEQRTRVSDLPTPVLTLDAAAMEHNIAVMDAYLADVGAVLAPHGKTTMSPQLWHRQIDAGAWAITVATPWQLQVAVENGVRRVQHAGANLDPAALRSIAGMLDNYPDLEILAWVDSPASVELTGRGYPTGSRPLSVLVDRGAPGARTGARTLEESIDTARAVHESPHLHLAGVAAWEGSLHGALDPGGRSLVARFCDGAAETFCALVDAGYLRPEDGPIITGGGSEFFDIVVERWAPLKDLGAQIVLRSGCYLTHDDGGYARYSPFGRGLGTSLRAALHIWAQVVSHPEPELALLNAGRRDVPYDNGLPTPQLVLGRDRERSAVALDGAHLSEVNDQHGYLALDPSSDLRLGDIVRMGISHPCMAFNKWTMVPVIDDTGHADPTVIGAVRTYF